MENLNEIKKIDLQVGLMLIYQQKESKKLDKLEKF